MDALTNFQVFLTFCLLDNDHGDHGDLEIKPIVVTYNWEQFSEEDTTSGIAVILIYGLVTSLALLSYVVFHETE